MTLPVYQVNDHHASVASRKFKIRVKIKMNTHNVLLTGNCVNKVHDCLVALSVS